MRQPQKSITVSENLIKEVQEIADGDRRSWSEMAVLLMEIGVRERTRKKKKKDEAGKESYT